MSTTTMVPVTISREALACIDRLGQQEEFETMIDRARQTVPGLRSIEVVLDESTEEMPAAVVLWTHRDDMGLGNDPMHRNWIDWMAATFPPEGHGSCFGLWMAPSAPAQRSRACWS